MQSKSSQQANKPGEESFKLHPVVKGNYSSVKCGSSGLRCIAKGTRSTRRRDAPGTTKREKKALLKYAQTYNLGKQQEELKLHVQMLNCDITGVVINEIWWNNSVT